MEEKAEPVLHRKVSVPEALRLTLAPLHMAVELLTVNTGASTLTATVVSLTQLAVLVPVTV